MASEDSAESAKGPKGPPSPTQSPKGHDGSMLICFCHGVSELEIRAAIRAGAITIDKIQEVTRASTGCGGCRAEVERILAEELTAKKS